MKLAVVALGYPLTHRVTAISALALKLGGDAAYWTHALRTAHLAALVSRAAKVGHPDEHFAAGLLHDVGKAALLRYLKPPHERILQATSQGGAAETRVLGTTHAEIGACVCERWRLPAPVVAAARHHADAADALEELQIPREALVVAAACRLARDGADPARWIPFLRVPPDKVAALQAEAVGRARDALPAFAA